jgi:sulfhydrogenase subunit gamma (sulfur reductase)
MSEDGIKLQVTEFKNISNDLAQLTMVANDPASIPSDFIPGQVAVLSLDGESKAYFAIASAPGESQLEFLVKRGKGVSGELFDRGVGCEVTMTGPVGKGFPIDQYHGHDLLLMAAGTAIAPIRSALRSALKHRDDFGRIVLVYGVREPAHFAFQEEIAEWRAKGILVVLTVSQPVADGNWSGAIGYVQHRLEDVAIHLQKPVAVICGMKDMMQQTTEQLSIRFPGIEVLTNF